MRFAEEKRAFLAEQVNPFLPDKPKEAVPTCSVFDQCGGCHLQHVVYEEQLSLKRRILLHAFAQQGLDLSASAITVSGMDHPWNYRNKADFNARTFDGNLHLGFLPIGGVTFLAGLRRYWTMKRKIDTIQRV